MSWLSQAVSNIGGAVKKVASVAVPIAAGGILGFPGIVGGVAKLASKAGEVLGTAAANKETASRTLPAAMGAVSVAYEQAKAQQGAQNAQNTPAALQAGGNSWVALLLKNASTIKTVVGLGVVFVTGKVILSMMPRKRLGW
jgi:hypothetical protein